MLARLTHGLQFHACYISTPITVLEPLQLAIVVMHNTCNKLPILAVYARSIAQQPCDKMAQQATLQNISDSTQAPVPSSSTFRYYQHKPFRHSYKTHKAMLNVLIILTQDKIALANHSYKLQSGAARVGPYALYYLSYRVIVLIVQHDTIYIIRNNTESLKIP